jgi:hypothetical protein
MITESGIKAALWKAGAGQKTGLDLRDDGDRGAGRLVLTAAVTARTPHRLRNFTLLAPLRRLISKLGRYPGIPLQIGGLSKPRCGSGGY